MQGFLTQDQKAELLYELKVERHARLSVFLDDGTIRHYRKRYIKISLDAKEVVAYIQNKFGVSYSLSGVTALLYSKGLVYKKAKAIPGKADPEKQESFISEYQKLKSGREGRIYFANSTHPKHNLRH